MTESGFEVMKIESDLWSNTIYMNLSLTDPIASKIISQRLPQYCFGSSEGGAETWCLTIFSSHDTKAQVNFSNQNFPLILLLLL